MGACASAPAPGPAFGDAPQKKAPRPPSAQTARADIGGLIPARHAAGVPLALGALSLLAGVAIGAALPRTVIETRTVRVAREPLRGARGGMETLKSAVGEVGEKVKEAMAGGVAEGEKLREAAMRAANKAS